MTRYAVCRICGVELRGNLLAPMSGANDCVGCWFALAAVLQRKSVKTQASARKLLVSAVRESDSAETARRVRAEVADMRDKRRGQAVCESAYHGV